MLSHGDKFSSLRVTVNLFSVLGVTPAQGRDFNPDDATRNEPAVILAHSTWQTHFGGDAAILNRTIDINGLTHRVIGVMKPDFQYLSEGTALWLPMKDPATTDDRTARGLLAVGRIFARDRIGADRLFTLLHDGEVAGPAVRAHLLVRLLHRLSAIAVELDDAAGLRALDDFRAAAGGKKGAGKGQGAAKSQQQMKKPGKKKAG